VVLPVMTGAHDGNANRHGGPAVQEQRRTRGALDVDPRSGNSRKTSLRLNLFRV
jgi:hypothetical protein